MTDAGWWSGSHGANFPPCQEKTCQLIVRVHGAAVQSEVKLNGEVVGQSVPYGFFYVDKKPGNYEVMTSTEVDRKLSMTLESGQTRFVRLSISFGFFVGHVYPELVEDEIGRQEIQDLRYIGNSGP